MSNDRLALGLADALLAGPAHVDDFRARLSEALGRSYRCLRGLAGRVCRKFGPEIAYHQRQVLIEFIRGDPAYTQVLALPARPRLRRYFVAAPSMARRTGALADCVVQGIATPVDLADWLGITMVQLEWYADLRGMIRSSDGALGHYRYRWIPKRQGNYRLIDSPKPRLREIERKILHEILDRIPPHDAAHGFRRGRSCASYAAPHVGQAVVLRLDL